MTIKERKKQTKIKNKIHSNRGVYLIIINDGEYYYIGSSVNILSRFKQHKKDLLTKYKLPAAAKLELVVVEYLPQDKNKKLDLYETKGYMLYRETFHWLKYKNIYENKLINKFPMMFISNSQFH